MIYRATPSPQNPIWAMKAWPAAVPWLRRAERRTTALRLRRLHCNAVYGG